MNLYVYCIHMNVSYCGCSHVYTDNATVQLVVCSPSMMAQTVIGCERLALIFIIS